MSGEDWREPRNGTGGEEALTFSWDGSEAVGWWCGRRDWAGAWAGDDGEICEGGGYGWVGEYGDAGVVIEC